MSNSLPLPVLVDSDPQDTISRALLRVTEASGGNLRDFTVHSPTTAIIEGQVFAQEEFLYALNQLPSAVLIKLLNIFGVQLATGTASYGRIQVTLISSLGSDFVIPPGWRVQTNDGLTYITTESITIPVGQISGSANIVSEVVGSLYNVPAGAISVISPGSLNYAFIAAVANESSVTGGTDSESVDEALTRGAAKLHSRSALISAADYENLAETLTGDDSRAIAVPLLGSDRSSRELGAVHVFILNSDLSSPSASQLVYVTNEIQKQTLIGTAVYVSAVELLEVSISVIVRLIDGANPDTAFEDIRLAIDNYLDPFQWDVTRRAILYKELEYLARNNRYVDYVQGVYISSPSNPVAIATNIAITKPYQLPRMLHLTVQMVNDLGDYSYGYGFIPDEFADTQIIP